MGRIVNRRLGLALLKGFLLGLVVAMILGGLRSANVQDWQGFMAEHAGLFLAWRLTLYGLIAWGGWRVCLRQAESGVTPEFRRRWQRIGIGVIGTIALLEVSQWLQGA
jgi:uncharacterized BrkB/YihY/UPF0761 family membrane protein